MHIDIYSVSQEACQYCTASSTVCLKGPASIALPQVMHIDIYSVSQKKMHQLWQAVVSTIMG